MADEKTYDMNFWRNDEKIKIEEGTKKKNKVNNKCTDYIDRQNCRKTITIV